MKRMLAVVALAVICLAAGGALWWHAQKSSVSPAQLVPAETLLLADFPDLPATSIRWKQTALHDILHEPQIQDFLAQPLAALKKNNLWAGLPESLAQIKPQQAFLAVASVTNNMPSAVAGLSFNGKRADVERLVARVRAQARSASPNGKLDRLRYRNFTIETFADRGITVAGCFARNWYFVANDLDLLKSTLDRFSGKTVTTLESASVYRQCQSPLPLHSDFRVFTQPGVISDRILAHLNAANPQEGIAALRKIHALSLSTRLEGPRLRSSLFLYQPETAQRPVLNGETLGLTTPNTLFYVALAPLISNATPQRGAPQVFPNLIPLRTLLAALHSPPATLDQIKTAFGPELAFLLDWPSKDDQPTGCLVCEIRDRPEALRFMESAFHAWSRADTEGASFWTLTMEDPTMSQFHPTVALTAHHFLAALSLESLKPFASSAAHPRNTGVTLEKNPAFQGAMATLPKPQVAIAYLDAKPLFERVYGFLRPFIMIWGASSEGMSKKFDFSKLPTAAPITNHLAPICLSAVQTNSGVLMESTGPVSFIELGESIGIGVLLLAMSDVQESPSGVRKGILPSSPAKPLSVPQIFTSPSSPATSQPITTPLDTH